MAARDVSLIDRYGRWPLPGALTAIQPALDIGRFRTAKGEAGMRTHVNTLVITGDRPGGSATIASTVNTTYS
jgi:hypothetical protein